MTSQLEIAETLAQRNATWLRGSWKAREQERVWIQNILRFIADCGNHGEDVAALRVAVAKARESLADMERGGGHIPRSGEPSETCMATELEQLRWRVEVAEGEVAVIRGTWCNGNMAEGRGPCGICPTCAQAAYKRAEKAEIELASKRDALAVTLTAAGGRLGEIAAQIELLQRERDGLRVLLDDIRALAEERLDPDESSTVICVRRGRGHTEEEDWHDALQVIRDWIDRLPPWAPSPGESYEEQWLRMGYRVEWSEREPRAYEVRPVGCTPRDNDYLARLRTVREVDEWIRRAGPMAAGEEGRVGHGGGLADSGGGRDRDSGDDDPVPDRG